MNKDDRFDPQSLEEEIDNFWSTKSIDMKASESRERGEKIYAVRPPIPAKDCPNWDEIYLNIVYDVWSRFKSMHHFHVRNDIGLDPFNSRIEKILMRDEDTNHLKALPDEKRLEMLSEIEDKSRELMEITSDELRNLGLWMTSEFDYKTTSGEFVDSVWWSFKKLNEKDLLVKKEKPLRWCPECRVSPSSSEISIKEEKKEKIFIKIPLTSGKGRYFLLEVEDIWMLPASLNIAVNPDFEYAVVKIYHESENPEQFVMLDKNIDNLMDELDIEDYEIYNTIDGKNLEGLSFTYPLEEKIPEKTEIENKNSRKVIISDEVDDEGTGFIPVVPEYKEEHWEIAEEKNLGRYNPVLKNGYFDEGYRKNKYSGLSTVESESVIIEDLKSKDLLLAKKKIDKKIEMCDLCRNRLIRYPVRGWFLEASQIEEQVNEAMEEIDSIPSSEDIIPTDWLLSRDKIWGIPLPRWECNDCGYVFLPSDREDLAEISDFDIEEDIKVNALMTSRLECPECGVEMKREKKVLDPLFVQACSPWAQLGYPNKEEEYESWWPGKILLGKKSEDVDLLTANLTLSLGLFDEPCAEKIISLGPISSGIEYKNVENIVSKKGHDSLRLNLLSDEPPWTLRRITRSDLEYSHPLARVVWNLGKFFEKNLEDLEIDIQDIESSFEGELGQEDKWILSALESNKKELQDYYEKTRLDSAIELLEETILEDVAQSYIKRCRTRLDRGDEKEKLRVMRTLYLLLNSISKLLAPVSPFTAEKVYQIIDGSNQSVFMEEWPKRDETYIDNDIEMMMDEVKNIVDKIMHIKRRSELPEKWPLRKVVYKAKNQKGLDLAEKFSDFIKDQAIVKNIEILESDEEWEKIIFKAEPNRDVIADSYNQWVRKIETLLNQKSSKKIKEGIEKGGFEMGLEGRIIEIDQDMVSFKKEIPEGFEEISLDDQKIFVDLTVTEEIWEKEMVREIILRLKSMRQDLDLSEGDELEVYLDADKDVIDAVKKNKNQVSNEVKARVIKLEEVDMEKAQYILEWDVNGEIMEIGIKPLYRGKMINYYSSISGLDTNTAELLYEAGYTTPDSILDVTPSKLSNIEGIQSDFARDILEFVEDNDIDDVLEEIKEEREEEVIEEKREEEIEEEVEEKEEIPKELPEGVSKSSTYLIEEKTSDKSFKLLKTILETGETGLCVTRDYPEKVKKKYNIEDIEMIWLSNVDREDVIRPKSLEKLSLALENFIAKTGGVILLKGLEYVITNNDFRTVLNLIQSIKDQVAVHESILLIPVDPSLMEKYQLDQLNGVVDRMLEE